MGKFEINEARRASGLKNKVVYQLFLRTFTDEGTFAAAAEKLDYLASLGIDIVYFCPFCETDADENRDYWSPRQIASGIPNPKNPYRICDYYAIDPDYGTADDFAAFVKRAHELGLKVWVDLVYLHCGPGKFAEQHPDFLKHDAEGKVVTNHWNFPELDYNNPALCEHLWCNMEYWIRVFDVDGFRTDVGDKVPLFFWQEGRRRIDLLKPGMVMLNEGENPLAMTDTYDAAYSFVWGVNLRKAIRRETSFHSLRLAYYGVRSKNPDGALVLHAFENHDYVSDSYDHRVDADFPENTEAAFVLNFTVDGIPFLYNGNELADSRRHSLWNRPCDGFTIDWSAADSERARHRLALTRELCRLRHEDPLFRDADCELLKDDKLLIVRRVLGDDSLYAYFNFGAEAVTAPVACGTPILMGNCSADDDVITLSPGGYYLETL